MLLTKGQVKKLYSNTTTNIKFSKFLDQTVLWTTVPLAKNVTLSKLKQHTHQEIREYRTKSDDSETKVVFIEDLCSIIETF